MSVVYKRNSNYKNTPVRNGELGVYIPAFDVDFERTTVFEITQKYDSRPDRLAYDLYGDAKLWWIFALYNRDNIQDPIHDFRTGLNIFVPTKEYVVGL